MILRVSSGIFAEILITFVMRSTFSNIVYVSYRKFARIQKLTYNILIMISFQINFFLSVDLCEKFQCYNQLKNQTVTDEIDRLFCVFQWILIIKVLESFLAISRIKKVFQIKYYLQISQPATSPLAFIAFLYQIFDYNYRAWKFKERLVRGSIHTRCVERAGESSSSAEREKEGERLRQNKRTYSAFV